MSNVTVNDQFTLERALESLESAKAAEALLKHAQDKFNEIAERKDTFADVPDLSQQIEDAVTITDDFKNAIAAYGRGEAA